MVEIIMSLNDPHTFLLSFGRCSIVFSIFARSIDGDEDGEDDEDDEDDEDGEVFSIVTDDDGEASGGYNASSIVFSRKVSSLLSRGRVANKSPVLLIW